MARILIIDDDVSRHADLRAWCARIGAEGEIAAAPPQGGSADALVVHAGYGRRLEGFPRGRPAEAVRWILGDASYLFHEDLEAFRSLGRALPDVPILILTGGSERDVPLDEIRDLARGRTVRAWNVFDLVATTSLEEALSERSGGTDPARIESEVRHDLLNRLWSLAVASPSEIAEIVEGDEDQSSLDALVSRAPRMSDETRERLAAALSAVREGGSLKEIQPLARKAIEEIESR